MRIVNTAFDLLLAPFMGLGAWAGMFALSLFAALIVLFLFKVTSRQKRIREKKDLALAALLELALFRDHPRLSMAAFGRLLVANMRYLAEMLIPLAATLVPLCLIIIQAYACLAHRPLREGEATLLKVAMSDGVALTEQNVSVADSSVLKVETDPVRAQPLGEIAWRLRAEAQGRGDIVIEIDGAQVAKSVAVGTQQRRVSSARMAKGILNRLKEPSEPALSADNSVRSIILDYPACRYRVLGLNLDWFWAFFCATMLFAVILKGPLGVEI